MAFSRDDRSGGGYRAGGFSRGGDRGGFSRGGSSRGGFGGAGRSFGADRGDRQMFDAVCDNCGKSCQVPFRPTQGKPVYCSDCFEKMGGRDRDQSSDRPRFEDRSPRAPQAQGGVDLGAINAKLDKILAILSPAPVVKVKDVEAVSEPKTVKVADVVDLPKIKKAVKKVASEVKK